MHLLYILFLFVSEMNGQIALPTFQGVQSTIVSNTTFTDTLTFTNCSVTGRNGPTQSQVNTAYGAENPLYNLVTINTQGIQEWTVPATGTYKILVWGAQGGPKKGYSDDDITRGGKGAILSGDFNLTQNWVLKIIVGQRGKSSGGGGGVSKSDMEKLIAAAAQTAPAQTIRIEQAPVQITPQAPDKK